MRSRAQWLAVFGVLVSLMVGGPLFAAPQLTWDPGSTNSAGGGGTGTWNTANWWNSSSDTSWQDGSDATFGGTSGTVTITSQVIPNNLVFASSGYTITGSTLNLGGGTISLNNAPAVVQPNDGNPTPATTISSFISGTHGLFLTGGGALILTNSSSYTGGTTINSGLLFLTGGGVGKELGGASGGSVTVNSSGTLEFGGGSSAFNLPNPIVMNGGTLLRLDSSSGSLVASGPITLNSGNNTIETRYDTKDLYLPGGLFGSAPVTFTQYLPTGNNGFGGGTIHLLGAGTYSGTATFTGQSNHPYPVSLENNAALQFAVVNMGASGFLRLGPTLTSGTIAGLTGTAGTIYNNDGTQRTLVINNAISNTYAGRLGDGTTNGNRIQLTTTGPGVLTLNGANTYSGGTTISSGTLAVGPAGKLGTGNVTITPGALLDLSAFSTSGYTLASGAIIAGRTSSPATDVNGSLNVNGGALAPAGSSTMTISGSLSMTGGSLNYNLGGIVALPNGALTLTGSDYVVPQLLLSAGTYNLFTYNNGTPNVANLNVVGTFFSARQTYTFGASAGTVNLQVSGSGASLLWRGGTWDNNSSKSWFNTTTGTTDVFFPGDATTFDDSAGTANGSVNINATVQPGTLTISNTAVNYTFGGAGSIAGPTALLKNGTGSLTINTSNSYGGGTNLSGGVLNANAANSLGTGPVTLNSGALNLGNSAALSTVLLTINGGSLDNTSSSAMTLSGNNAQNWNGDFTFNGTQSLNVGTGAVTLGSSRTVTVNGGTLTVGGAISGSGYSLTKAGPGAMVLTAQSNYTGGTIVNGGTLNLSFNNGGTGTLHDGLTINPGGTVVCMVGNALGYNGTNWVQNITINGGALMTSIAANDNGWDTTITMTGGTLGSTVPAGYFAMGTPTSASPPTFNIMASATPAVISANLTDRNDNSSPGIVFNVTRGSAASDLNVTGNILAQGAGSGIILNGNGVTVLSDANTYTGGTVINGGTLQIGNGGGNRFAIPQQLHCK